MKHKLMMYVLLVFIIFLDPACSTKKNQAQGAGEGVAPLALPEEGALLAPQIDYYTCSMHPQVHADEPGSCPICHMPLVPVYKKQPPHPATSDGSAAAPIGPSVSISTSTQNLSGVRVHAVTEKDASKTIRASAKVAYDPELAVAIREFQEVSKTVPSLKSTAVTRLRHLGLSDREISRLSLTEDLSSYYHLGSPSGPLWIYATLFEEDASAIKGDENVEIEIMSAGETKIVHGILRSLSPVVDSSTRTIRARIEVPSVEERKHLRPDSYVTARIRIPLGRKLTVPKSALIDTGERRLVYVRHGEDHFQEQEVSVGGEADGEWVILEGLKSGDLVVVNATFLVDSETRLRGGSAAGHQH